MVSPLGKSGIWATVGAVLVVLTATLGWILYPNIINSQFVLQDGSQLYTQWQNPPVPIFMKFYLFNCTNSDEVLHGETPKVEQVGPFTYRETRVKREVQADNGALAYQEVATYYYSPTEEDSLLDVQVTTLNPIYVSLASLIHEMNISDWKKSSITTTMSATLSRIHEGPFMTHTADELIFKGWSLEPYTKIIETLNSTIFKGGIPALPEDLRFGFYFGRNGTSSGQMNIDSGANNLDSLGMINSFKGNPDLNGIWPTEYCNMLNGTDGEIFPPSTAQNTKTNPEKRMYVFNPDLCRSIYAIYTRDDTVSGIAGKRFEVPENVFGNYTENPENRCYCRSLSKDGDGSKCFDAGILDMRPCQHGLPILLSTPHFFKGSKKYIDGVEGMNPNQTLHETFITIEDTSSVVLAASKRIQINLDFRKYNALSLRKVKDTVFPILWADESVVLDDDDANQIKLLNAVILGVNIGRWCLLGIGILLTLSSAIAGLVLCKRQGISV